MNQVAPTAKIFPGVKLGKNVVIEDFCVIGRPASGKEKETIIGDNAIIRSHTVIYRGNTIGNNFHTGHGVNIRENNIIGNDVSIGTHSIVEHQTVIEDGVRIHSNVFVPEFTTLKSNCWLGPNVVLTNAKYPQGIDVKKTLKGPTIEEDAKLGAGCVVLPGIIIGARSLIGAGSVVTKNLEAGKVYIGNPAKSIKELKALPYN